MWRMSDDNFRDRFLTAFKASGLTVAELSRRSGVNYHTIDKLKKGTNLNTSADNAKKLASALGMDNEYSADLRRLINIYLALPDDKQKALLSIAATLSQH